MKHFYTFLCLIALTSLAFGQSLVGTWKLTPAAGSLGVGPAKGDVSWWNNALADVTSRACLFDDEYKFNADGTFQNIQGGSTWIEKWQSGSADACGTPIAPHNGSAAATYTHSTTANTVTLTGTGAYLGLPKAYNGGELTSPSGAPASITYLITELTATTLTLDIEINGGAYWRYKFTKQGVAPSCTDGIQNGNETGVDCGGSCPNTCLTQMNVPVTFEDATVDYGVIPFGNQIAAIVANPVSGGLNTSAKVVKVDKPVNAADWAGTTVTNAAGLGFATPLPFTATNRKMNILVYSPDSGIPVLLKVEEHGDNTHSVETLKNTTVANQWEILEFDFNNQRTGTAAFDASYTYDKASIFFNFGTTGAIAGAKTYYFDDVKFGPIVTAGVDDINSNNSLKFYPNPVKTGSSIKFSEPVKSVEIYNLNGMKVQSSIGDILTITVSKGAYIMSIKDANDKVSNQKLIVN